MTPTDPLAGPFMPTARLTSYPEALDTPRPEGMPSGTALRMASLLRADTGRLNR
jgi:hypothetical protein